VGKTLMADYGSEVAAEYEVSREDQDRWALRSQQRYAEALSAGRLADEIVAVEIPQRRGDPTVVNADEQPRPDTSMEALAALKPLHPGGSVTPGNAPGVNDDASAILLALFLARRLTRPVDALVSAAERLGAGDFSIRTHPSGVDRLGDEVQEWPHLCARPARSRARNTRTRKRPSIATFADSTARSSRRSTWCHGL